MNKIFEIQKILNIMAEEIGELLVNEDMDTEDILRIALENALNLSSDDFSKKEYNQLIAEIDREYVNFVVDDDFQIPLYNNELLIGDDDEDLY